MPGAADGQNDLVVIIDDDVAVGDSMAFLLESAGYRTMTFRSAAGFLSDREVRPACLIVDHHMPDMNGLRLAERLHQASANIPFLLVTAALTPAIASGAARFGVQEVLAKPFEPDDLLKFVAASLASGDH